MAKRALKLEDFDSGLLPAPEPVIVPRQIIDPEVKPDLPEELPGVDFVMSLEEAFNWLHSTDYQRRDCYKSVVYLGQGATTDDEASYIAGWCWASLIPGGILYVPEYLVALPALVNKPKADKQGKDGLIALQKSNI